MSTYLVAFIVSKFTCDSTNDLEGSLLNQVKSQVGDNVSNDFDWFLSDSIFKVANF